MPLVLDAMLPALNRPSRVEGHEEEDGAVVVEVSEPPTPSQVRPPEGCCTVQLYRYLRVPCFCCIT